MSVNLKSLNYILDELIAESKEYVFREVNIPLENNYWFKSNLGMVKSGKIKTVDSEKTLKLSVDIEKHAYLSYMDNGINFTSIPKFDCDILPGKMYKISFMGKCDKELNVRLYVISYSKEKKIQQTILEINKETEFEFDKNCVKYRIAMRFSGKGNVEVNSINFKPIEISLKNKDIIYESNSNNKNYEKRKIKNVSDVKIACILDEFSQSSFSKECEMITFTPKNFVEVLENNRPDFLLVESAWKGINGSWEFKIAKYNNQDKSALYGLLNYCKANGIPTVFWNKEDPIHFEKFIDTAKLFDHVFTTDRNIINKYKEIVGHNNVYSLPFAAQVKSNNPINKYVRKKGVCFAGSYYGNRHADRKKDMDNVLTACKSYNLEIYDRNYNKTIEDKNSPFRYPEEFQGNLKGSLPYTEIDRAYKGYEVMLNVNSVKDSPTMFSRRVFEGLASGTPIISTYSKGINEMFGDIIISDDNEKVLVEKIDKLMNDNIYWKTLSLNGIRKVMFNHTYENRIRYMLSKLSIEVKRKSRKVSIISFVRSL
ncbi:MAG: CgeB family protein, partial [Clostridium sp.]